LSAYGSVKIPGFDFRRRGRIKATVSAVRTSFREYIDKHSAGRFIWYRHCVVLAEALQRVADGELERLMVFMPPRHGKSELVSRWFPAYMLDCHPERWVGLGSYGQKLADSLSRSARKNFVRGGGSLDPEARAVREWKTTSDGGMWASGVGGAATGLGSHVGVIDDPFKDSKEADSAVVRETVWDWWRTVFYTRLQPSEGQPNGAVVVMFTRWHTDDMGGRLLDAERGDEPENWHIIAFDAIRDETSWGFPETCTLEPDWRDPGEPLCPELYDVPALRKIEAALGPRHWAALYQQRPRPKEGRLIKFEWFKGRDVSATPTGVRRWVYAWDLAGTEDGGDFTSGTLSGYDRQQKLFYVAEVTRGQWSTGHRDQKILRAVNRATERLGIRPEIAIEKPSGIGGQERARAVAAILAAYKVTFVPATGSKEHRSEPFRSQLEVGNVRYVRGSWNAAWIDELCDFGPGCKHDDQVDSTSTAHNELTVAKGVGSMEGLI